MTPFGASSPPGVQAPGSHLFEATITHSPETDPVVRRKPLPTASPVIPTHPRGSGPSPSWSSSSSLYSIRSLSQADPPARFSPLQSPASIYSHSPGSSVANSLSSPVSNTGAPSSARGDPSLYTRRTIDRYDNTRSSTLLFPLHPL
ncbi:hypothetical protein BDW74DRAFT_152262 [Aspergillus multicolor]|uniref:uncharacterized protein n=1 Tax=Aspergillus multicolor TaxID=41759 RepID=UPI003CCD2DCF